MYQRIKNENICRYVCKVSFAQKGCRREIQTFSPESLKSKDELMHWLVEHGANHLQLMDFCSDYMAKYCNELCWQYPISDGKHLGTYIVLVKEGVLSLPYPKHNHSDSKSEKGIQNE